MSRTITFNTLRFPDKAALLLRALVLLGYPLCALAITFLGLGASSASLSVPYRVGVLALALYVIGANLGTRQRGRIDGLLLTFFVLYTARLLYDWWFPDIAGASYALLYFFMLVVFPACACMLAGTDVASDELFAKFLLCFGLVFCIGALGAQLVGLSHNPWEKHGIENNRLTFEALNPISVGNAAAITLISAFYLFVVTRLTHYWRLAVWAGLGLGGAVLVVANSRGPIVASTVAVAGFFALRFRRAAHLVPLVLLGSLAMAANPEMLSNIVARFVASDPFAINLSNQERLVSQAAAIQSFFNYPIFGEHYIDPALGDGAYPHNIIIETAMALGLIGLTLLGFMLVHVWLNTISFYNRSHPLLVMLFFQYFVAMQFSGALYGADAFFLLLGLALTARHATRPLVVAVQQQFRRQSN